MPEFKKEGRGFKMKGWSAFTKKDDYTPQSQRDDKEYTPQSQKQTRVEKITKETGGGKTKVGKFIEKARNTKVGKVVEGAVKATGAYQTINLASKLGAKYKAKKGDKKVMKAGKK